MTHTTRIIGTGKAVPRRVVTNDELASLIDTSDEWILQRTGIQQRYWVSPGESGSELAHQATQQALEMAGIPASELDAILYSTSTPDHAVPGSGVFLHRRLGVGNIPAIDLRTQCSGFVYALSMADAYIRAGLWRTILVVGSEVQSTGMDISDQGRNTAVIFADGAGVAVVRAENNPGGSAALGWDLHADGTHAEKLWVDAPGSIYHPRNQPGMLETRGYLSMDGREVFRHATTRMPESVRAVLQEAGKQPEDLKLLIPHQANLRISESVQKSLGLRDDQVYNNIQRYGNTTSASIPIALDECVRSGRLERGDLLALTAFGSGFIWGSGLLRW